MDSVCAGLDRSVEDGTRGTAQIGTKVCLHLEFLNRVHRRKNDKVCPVEEVDGVGVVVNTVQQVVILGRTQAIGRKGTRCRIASRVSLRRVHASTELRQEREITSIQRKAIHCLLINHLTD